METASRIAEEWERRYSASPQSTRSLKDPSPRKGVREGAISSAHHWGPERPLGRDWPVVEEKREERPGGVVTSLPLRPCVEGETPVSRVSQLGMEMVGSWFLMGKARASGSEGGDEGGKGGVEGEGVVAEAVDDAVNDTGAVGGVGGDGGGAEVGLSGGEVVEGGEGSGREERGVGARHELLLLHHV